MPTLFSRPDQIILATAGVLLALAFCLGLLTPPLFTLALAAATAGGVIFIVYCFPTAFCVAWLLVTGMSLEMAFNDLIGPEAYQPTIAAVKGIELGLGALLAARFGLRLDLLCPAWAFLVMAMTGPMHGLWPGMTIIESLRSVIGSITPFVFCFCRAPRSWASAIIQATKWCPLVAVAACLPLSAAGIRPLFVDSFGERLGGLGHPAFLAGICLSAIYACLIQLYRDGRRGDLILLIVNFLILILTGARAPFGYAVAVTGISLIWVRSNAFTFRHRLTLIMGTLALVPALALVAGDVTDVRLFNVVLNEASNLSGRELLWPEFEAAAALSPWFGWGVGAGNNIIPPDGRIAELMQTWAAHNEYLRIGVEGGVFGEALLIGLFAAWVIVRTRGLCASDRRVMRLVFLAFAGHAATDNILISTPVCVMLAFAAAVFAQTSPE